MSTNTKPISHCIAIPVVVQSAADAYILPRLAHLRLIKSTFCKNTTSESVTNAMSGALTPEKKLMAARLKAL